MAGDSAGTGEQPSFLNARLEKATMSKELVGKPVQIAMWHVAHPFFSSQDGYPGTAAMAE